MVTIFISFYDLISEALHGEIDKISCMKHKSFIKVAISMSEYSY